MRLALALLLAVLLAFPAEARLKTGPIDAGSGHRLKSLTVQEGMTTSLAAAYSFRKVRSAYAGSAMQLRRVDNSALANVGFTAGGDFDTAAATSHCAGTSCTVATWYDQSPNGRNATAGLGNQPDLIFNCQGAQPCVRTDSNNDIMQSVSVTWAATKTSLSAVGRRVAGTANCVYIGKNVNWLVGGTANTWQVMDNTTGSFTAPAADNAWHAGIGIIDGASSLARIDTTETAGSSVTGTAAAGVVYLAYGAAAGTTCDYVESLIWDNYALTQPERTALAENQRNYYTPLPLDTFATPAAAYSMRRLKSTYTGPGIRLRRASDNAEADINFLGFTGFTGAPIDTAAANAHCAATTCWMTAWYDQSGNARHATMATAATQPAFVASCVDGLPCARVTTAQYLASANVVPATGKVSFSAVAKRAATGQCYWATYNTLNIFVTQPAVANSWGLSDSTLSLNATAADGLWHAASGVINGASTVLRIDGTETAGNVAGSTATGSPIYLMAQFSGTDTCEETESLIWDDYALSPGERTTLQNNQKNFWGTP